MSPKENGAPAVATQGPDRTKLNADILIEPSPASQAEKRGGRAVATAQRAALVRIKRGSLWTIAIEAGSWLDALVDIIEEDELGELVPTTKIFISHAKAIAALVRDFETERGCR